MISTSLYIVGHMNSITQIVIFTFLFALSFGTQVLAPVVDTKLTGVGFYKLGLTVVLSALMLALGLDIFMKPELSGIEIGCYALLLITNALTYFLHKDEKSVLMWIFYVVQVITFSVLSFHVFNFDPAWLQFFFITTGLIAISNFAMILGHYYLVVPKLSFEPLFYCLMIFWCFIFTKLFFSLSVLLGPAAPYLVEGTTLGDGYMYNWLFISMRYLWGYAAPIILSFFTYRLCQLKSNQSATGVLYIIEFFVIVGELISIYLMAKHGLAL